MNWVDITILVLLSIGALLGALSGLLWQVARFVIFGVAVYVTIYYHGPMADFLKANLTSTDPAILKGLSYFLTFVLTYLVLFLLTMLVERWVKAMKLKWLDRLLGAGLGVVKAGLICAVLLLGVAIVPIKSMQPDVEASHLAPPILLGVRGLAMAIPDEEKARVSQWFDEMKADAEERVEEAQKDAVEEAVKRAIERSQDHGTHGKRKPD